MIRMNTIIAISSRITPATEPPTMTAVLTVLSVVKVVYGSLMPYGLSVVIWTIVSSNHTI